MKTILKKYILSFLCCTLYIWHAHADTFDGKSSACGTWDASDRVFINQSSGAGAYDLEIIMDAVNSRDQVCPNGAKWKQNIKIVGGKTLKIMISRGSFTLIGDIELCPQCTMIVEEYLPGNNGTFTLEGVIKGTDGDDGRNGDNGANGGTERAGKNGNVGNNGTDGGNNGTIIINSGKINVAAIRGGHGGHGGNGGRGGNGNGCTNGGRGAKGGDAGHGGNAGTLVIYGGSFTITNNNNTRGGNGGNGGRGGNGGWEGSTCKPNHDDGSAGGGGNGGNGGDGPVVRIYGGVVGIPPMNKTKGYGGSGGSYWGGGGGGACCCVSPNPGSNCLSPYQGTGDGRAGIEGDVGRVHVLGGALIISDNQLMQDAQNKPVYKNSFRFLNRANSASVLNKKIVGGRIDGYSVNITTQGTVSNSEYHYGLKDVVTSQWNNGLVSFFLPAASGSQQALLVLEGQTCSPYKINYSHPAGTITDKTLESAVLYNTINYGTKDAPSGCLPPAVTQSTAYCGVKYLYPDYTGCPTGFSFKGWSGTKSTSNVDYYPFTEYRETIGWDPTTKTLYAECTTQMRTYLLLKNASSGILVQGTNYVEALYGGQLPAVDAQGQPLVPPTRLGYLFRGYNINQNANWWETTYHYDSIMTPRQNSNGTNNPTLLYAMWEPIRYDITYDKNTTDNVTPIPPATLTEQRYDTPFTTSTTLQRAGYTHFGWDTISGTANHAIFGTNENVKNLTTEHGKIIVLYAVWKPNQYLITFDRRGGLSGSSSAIATYDSLMPAAAAPLRNGYVFLGYYDDPIGIGKRYYDGSMSRSVVWDKTHNDTLYARWQTTTMDIPLEKMGGSGGSDMVSAAIYGNPMPMGVMPPVKDGYVFKGYWSLPNGGVQYYDGSMQGIILWDAQYDRLFAHWDPDTFNITLKHNYGSIQDSVIRVVYREMNTLPQPSRGAWSFRYWALNDMAPLASLMWFDQIEYLFTRDTILYAQWVQGSYTLSFNTNYAGMTKPPINVKQGEQIGVLPDLIPSQYYGYHMVGWFYPDTNTNNPSPPRRQYLPSSIYDIGHDTTFSAKWEANQHTLWLHAWGGVVAGSDSIALTVYYSSSVGVLPIAHRRGADFLGYHDDKQSFLDAYYGISRTAAWQNNATYAWDYDRTIYAHWRIRTDTIYFDSNGGDAAAPMAVRYDSLIGQMPAPMRKGHTFMGWHRLLTSPSAEITADSIYHDDGNLTLYAHWRKNTYQVRFVCPDRADTTIYVLFGERINPPYPDPMAAGRIFAGWYLPGVRGARWDFAIDSVEGHTTLTARWHRHASIIDVLPQCKIVYGTELGAAVLRDGMHHYDDGSTGDGYWAFTSPSIVPNVSDGDTTKYEIGFFPYDTMNYEPAYDSIMISVQRRQLYITAQSATIILKMDNTIVPPGTWSDVLSYISQRWDAQGLAPCDAGRLQQILPYPVAISLAHDNSYYNQAGLYPAEVIPTGAHQTDNYVINYTAGNLYVSRLTFMPPDSIVYGSRVGLAATHESPLYTGTIRYFSRNPAILSVSRTAAWNAEGMHTGIAEVCAYSDGNSQLPPDTACSAIRVVPMRGIVVKPGTLVREYALPLPSRYELTWQSADLADTFYMAGLKITAMGIPSDTPPPGDYDLVPCCISHPNYADFNYQKGLLTVIQGGNILQEIEFDTLSARYYLDHEIPIFATARTQRQRSRPMRYESSNQMAANFVRDTTYTDPVWEDVTHYGAILRINAAGTTNITAYNVGDATYRAVYAVRRQDILKEPQTIDFAMPASIDSGETLTLRSRAILPMRNRPSGFPIYFDVDQFNPAVHLQDTMLTALQAGRAVVEASVVGNANYENVRASNVLIITDVNRGNLLDLKPWQGTLQPTFHPSTHDYDYTLPCSADTLLFSYDGRNKATIGSDEVGNKYVVEAFRQTPVHLNIMQPNGDITTYSLRLRPPLPKDYIYYNPSKFAHRMEIVNNPTALGGNRFTNQYKWFEDGRLLPDDTGGVLYRGGAGFSVGSVYSALAYYDGGSFYYTDSVYICGQTALPIISGMEVFPNPAGNTIMVRHPQLGQSDAPIEIYSATGQLAVSFHVQSMDIDDEDMTVELDISALMQGTYIVKYLNDSKKIVKQ